MGEEVGHDLEPFPLDAGRKRSIRSEQLIHGGEVGALGELLLLLQELHGLPPRLPGNVDDGLAVRVGGHGTLDALHDGNRHRVFVHFFTRRVSGHGGRRDLASQAGRETGSSIWIPAPSPGRRRI
jgi:hypothetical protein